jgi:hypothetical protein
MPHLAVDDEVLVRARVVMVRGDGNVHVKVPGPSGMLFYLVVRPGELIDPVAVVGVRPV